MPKDLLPELRRLEKMENNLRVYLVEQYCSTFGQTEAGCHQAFGPERIIISAPLEDGWPDPTAMKRATEEQVAFMEKARLLLHARLENGRLVKMPIEPSQRGFQEAMQVLRFRTGSDIFVDPAFGPHYLKIAAEDKLVLDPGGAEYDSRNLAYQRLLLGR
jgi:hypothetical protein